MTSSTTRHYATLETSQALTECTTTSDGLTTLEAEKRHKKYGLNLIQSHRVKPFKILRQQLLGNPLTGVLAAAALVSFFTGDRVTALYVLAMILVSALLGFWNEYAAEKTVFALLKRISLTVVVKRDNTKTEVPAGQITIGDIVLLSPGSVIPADMRLIEADNLQIDESALTGESMAVHKQTAALPPTKTKSATELTNIAFMGTHIESGWGSGVVVAIGRNTEYGKIAETTSFVRPQTQFQKGLAGFGTLIVKVIFTLTLVIFAVNAVLGHNILSSLLFALAIAVGLTPELLPVVVTVGLAHGAGKLAKRHVVTKQLIAIENLGNMDVLCTDKTGTLTEGAIEIADYINQDGKKDPHLLQLGLLCNSTIVHHKPIGNTIDVAIWQHAKKANIALSSGYKKLFEEPFDYTRQLMFCVANMDGHTRLIAKGSPEAVIKCLAGGNKKQLLQQFQQLSSHGYRVIALASKPIESHKKYEWDAVDGLHFDGFITFFDQPKRSALKALKQLHSLNVAVTVITGDSELVTKQVCQKVGMDITNILTGPVVEAMDDKTLQERVKVTNVFARVSPDQKLRIIEALQLNGHTVGYMGDGINDAPALHSADVGISVDTAIDVAKEAAQVVLLRKGLDTIAAGIEEGRKTFINTIKYILMGTGSNFGEMVSTAGASFILPFLPMTPSQILVENGLYDASQLPIASDNTDSELLRKPKHWDISLIYRFMIFFGFLSALWAFATYGILLKLLQVDTPVFQTVVFLESITTEMVIVMLVRTSRVPFYKSLPSKWLALSCVVILALSFYLPYSPLAPSLGLAAPGAAAYVTLGVLVVLYGLVIETVKRFFFKRYSL